MTQHYSVHGYRGHWEVHGPNGIVQKEMARKALAEWLCELLSLAYWQGVQAGVSKAEEVVLGRSEGRMEGWQQ